LTPQEFAEECLRILRYRLVDMATDLEDTSDGAGVRLTEKWCMERARQIAAIYASLGAPAQCVLRATAQIPDAERTPVGYALAIERPDPSEDDGRIT
jgi:hypothetical protein